MFTYLFLKQIFLLLYFIQVCILLSIFNFLLFILFLYFVVPLHKIFNYNLQFVKIFNFFEGGQQAAQQTFFLCNLFAGLLLYILFTLIIFSFHILNFKQLLIGNLLSLYFNKIYNINNTYEGPLKSIFIKIIFYIPFKDKVYGYFLQDLTVL